MAPGLERYKPNTNLKTLPQFRSLSGDIQHLVVQHFGVILLGRTGVGVTAKLYGVDGFYVELFYDEKMSEGIRLVSFDDLGKLELYLLRIDVQELVALLK